MRLRAIYDQYHGRVRAFIRALVKDQWAADDLTQETFARVQRSLGDLRESGGESSWIFRIAYNLCQDHFRASKRDSQNWPEPHEMMGLKEEIPILRELEQHQMGQCVRDQIDLLPESQRSVVVLFHIMDFSHQEVADTLGITIENAKVRLHRARKRLAAILRQRCTFEVDERNVLVCEPIQRRT